MSFLSGKYLAITIGEVELDISRKTVPGSTKNTYEMGVVRPAKGYSLTLDQQTISNYSTDLASAFPSGLTINFTSAIVARDVQKKKGAKATSTDRMMAANLSASIDLSDLPIAGKMFPKDDPLIIENLQILFSKNGVDKDPTGDFNKIIPLDNVQFPSPILQGANVNATLQYGSNQLSLGTSTMAQLSKATTAGNSSINTAPTKQSKGNVNKSFGPIHIRSVALGFSAGDLTVTIDASVAFGPLVLGFLGLEIGSPIDQFDPEFGLKGLTLDYHKNNFTLAGAFLNQGGGEYSGMFELALTKLQLTAIGSYKNDGGHPSLFVYGLLNEPLGGPAFFFVEGLAAAFGYNRNFIAPPVTAISGFPLVSAAFHGAPQQSSSGLATMMSDLGEYIPPKLGEYFVGLGVKFMSFKVVNSFALLIVKFGDELEFDLLGESTYVAPNPKDKKPIAVVQLEIVGSYKPALGTLLIRGQLTPNSFVLSKKCHLEGGFALANWFKGEYDGDFVYTFGGYGKHFKPPSHYPQNVPQLGFLWQVAPDVSIKGGGYWVLDPKKIVMGGYLLAAYSTSEVRASFEIDAFFEIDWSPLHYQASFTVTFSLSVYVDLLFVSGWLGFELSEGLEIHGPPFGGTAFIDLAVATIHINFGADPTPAPLLTGAEFAKAFLPDGGSDKILSINIVDGLVKQEGEIYYINPKDLHISTESFVPCTSFSGPTNSNGTSFEITPMGINFGDTNTSIHTVTITKGLPKESSPANDFFTITQAEQKEAPKSMWKNTTSTDADSENLSPLAFGTHIKPGGSVKAASATPHVKRSKLVNEKFTGNPYTWSSATTFDGSWKEGKKVDVSAIDSSILNQFKKSFGLDIATVSADGLKDRLSKVKDEIYVGTLSTQS